MPWASEPLVDSTKGSSTWEEANHYWGLAVPSLEAFASGD